MIRGAQRGAMSIVAAGVCLVLCLLLLATVTIGRLAIERHRMQSTTDALALACTSIAMREGLGAVEDHPALDAIANGNMSPAALGRTVSRRCVLRPGEGLAFDAEVVTPASILRPSPDGQGEEPWELETRGAARAEQETFGEAEQRYPKLVIVLDYSGSMGADFGGGTRTDALENAVRDLLRDGLRIEYGMISFSSGVITADDVARDNEPALINRLDHLGPGGMTNYRAPLDRARSMLNDQQDTGRYVLFVTDGYPNEGGGAGGGLQAADSLRRAGGTIFTLNIGGGAAQRNLLIGMSGGIQDAGDPGYYFEAGNGNQLQDTFRSVTSDILCRVGPLDPAPGPDDDIFAFLRDPGDPESESPLTNVDNPSNFPNALGFTFDPADQKLRLTEAACDAVVLHGKEVVARFGRPRLIAALDN